MPPITDQKPNGRSPAPIALFVYNRPEHTRKTVEALRKNVLAAKSDLYIFADGPKNAAARKSVDETREYIRTVSGFKSVTISEKPANRGLANSIIAGVTEIVNARGRVIVVEDDLVSSPYFLDYMNDGLDIYENDERVASIHGYVYPVAENLPETFFIRGADCWGWATWKRAWNHFESNGSSLLNELEKRNLLHRFDYEGAYHFSRMLKKQIAGTNDSWAVRWHASAFLRDMLTLYPGVSLVDNIGMDASGTHSRKSARYHGPLSERKIRIERLPLEENRTARHAFKEYFLSLRPNVFARILRKLFPS